VTDERIPAVDADAHLVEGAALAKELLTHWPEHVGFEVDEGGEPAIVLEGRRYPQATGPGAGCPPRHGLTDAPGADPGSVAGMLADADREGIETMVLFPSLGLAAPGLRDPAFARGFASLANELAADWCGRSGGRLRAAAVLPAEDVAASVAEMERARGLGLVCAVLPPALRERNLDHPDLDPLYAKAVELDLPVAVHGAPGVHLPKIGVDRFTSYVQVHCVSFPFDAMAALTAIVSGGVLERHPRLRVGFLEAGCTWLPYFLDRLHEHWEKRGDWIPGGWGRDPRAYLERGQIHLTCEAEESLLPAVLAALGDDFCMYASDYPHWDSEFPHSTKALRERPDLPDASRRKLLRDNARRFFGLP